MRKWWKKVSVLGGWVSDRFLGRYKTILWLSYGYVLGHAVLAGGDIAPAARVPALYIGLTLVAFGQAGIKPNAIAQAQVAEPGDGNTRESVRRRDEPAARNGYDAATEQTAHGESNGIRHVTSLTGGLALRPRPIGQDRSHYKTNY